MPVGIVKVAHVALLMKEIDGAILKTTVSDSKANPHDVQEFVNRIKKNRLRCVPSRSTKVDEKLIPLRRSAKTRRDTIERCQGMRCDKGQRFCRDCCCDDFGSYFSVHVRSLPRGCCMFAGLETHDHVSPSPRVCVGIIRLKSV